MNCKRNGLLFILMSSILAFSSFAAAGSAGGALPFAVTLGGQKAALSTPIAAFAKVAEAVASNAELVVDSKEAMVIVNIFDCDAKGEVASGSSPLIVLMQGTNKSLINKTVDGKAPKPGSHIMNIVAGGATARVFFTVK